MEILRTVLFLNLGLRIVPSFISHYVLFISQIIHYYLFNEVKIFIKVKLGKPLSLSIEVFIVLLLEFVCQ